MHAHVWQSLVEIHWVFWIRYHVWSTVLQNVCWGWGSYVLRRHVNYLSIYVWTLTKVLCYRASNIVKWSKYTNEWCLNSTWDCQMCQLCSGLISEFDFAKYIHCEGPSTLSSLHCQETLFPPNSILIAVWATFIRKASDCFLLHSNSRCFKQSNG